MLFTTFAVIIRPIIAPTIVPMILIELKLNVTDMSNVEVKRIPLLKPNILLVVLSHVQ
jgi:hypothetical protein